MGEDVKNELAMRAKSRAECGLYFLKFVVLPHIRSGTDTAYSRSAYILLSYNVELILSALFILGSKKKTEAEIIRDLIGASKQHNLRNLFSNIPPKFHFNIEDITQKNVNGFVQYNIKIGKSMIIIEDFTDVRYDFKKNFLRSINQQEGDELEKTITLLIEFVKNIK